MNREELIKSIDSIQCLLNGTIFKINRKFDHFVWSVKEERNKGAYYTGVIKSLNELPPYFPKEGWQNQKE